MPEAISKAPGEGQIHQSSNAFDEYKRNENAILDILGRSGTTLANVSPARSLLFLLSTIVPDFSFGILWKRNGAQYRRVGTTITDDDYKAHSPAIQQSFSSGHLDDVTRGPDVLTLADHTLRSLNAHIDKLHIRTAFGATLAASFVILLKFEEGYIAEIYCDKSTSQSQIAIIHTAAARICTALFSRLLQIYSVLLPSEDERTDLSDIRGNRRLFRQIFRDMKTWFGEDFRTVNVFSFNPRDRLLYHLETSHLSIDSKAVKEYKPVPEIALPAITNHVVDNIDAAEWPKGVDPEQLKDLLTLLGDRRKWKDKAVKEDAALLKALLTVMPQEPGTGIAGETAVTRIPQLGLDVADCRWQTGTPAYRGTFFAAMLSIEQMFGIGSSGNRMAAVPLTESGQLWGVLFFVQSEPYTHLRLLDLWEKGQHLSSVLSLFRTFQFQNAIIQAAGEKPHLSMGQLAFENLHLAVNPIFAIHWRLHGARGGVDQIERWQFDDHSKRFGLGEAIDPKKRPFNDGRIKERVHRRIKGKLEIVDLMKDDDEAVTGLSSSLVFPHRDSIRSAIMVPCPPYDLLAIYTDEYAETLKPFLAQFEERFSCLWDVHSIRENKPPDRAMLTQSQKVRTLLRKALRIVQNPRARNILLRGENGTGKEILAQTIHTMSGRRGVFVAFNVTEHTGDTVESHLFGHFKGSFTDAKQDKLGLFAIANNGSILLDEIGDLPPELQAKLLRVIQERKFYPIGAEEPIETDVLLMAATNKKLRDMVSANTFREDLYFRLREFRLEIPALRERCEDIPLLARHFLRREFPDQEFKISAKAMAALMNFHWPGNVRQLESIIKESGTYLESKQIIDLDDLSEEEIRAATGTVKARKVGNYVGMAQLEEDGCRGWALFSDETYDLEASSPQDDWTVMAFNAFQRLFQNGHKVKSYCSIGCGAALDAVIATHIWECNRVFLSDINEAVLAIAQENVNLNIRPISEEGANQKVRALVEIDAEAGDIFQSIPEERFDLIYENLPNLPWLEETQLMGTKLATFTKTTEVGSLDKWLLSTHERFLDAARDFLSEDGLVVCCIGARVPWESITEMFDLHGYVPELIHFGIKRQQQVDEVVSGYAQLESNNEPFTFLDLNATRDLLKECVSEEPEELRKLVMESTDFDYVRLTAKRALETNQSIENTTVIGHGVYVVSGRLKQGTRHVA